MKILPRMSSYQLAILGALQGKPMYEGTVPAHVKARRRRQNKAARIARRAHRKAN
ncbi:hypothetical protein [Brachybacterium phenoliresistens]|uniref:hypothetical protein n=1 Tax=Brachybacterium phenoliresistens TaxID=396014 RepID=UPI0031E40427